jgi:hypothetical protein
MNANESNIASNIAIDSRTVGAAEPAGQRRARNKWPWINWGSALSTVPGAALVMLFALGAVMSTDACSSGSHCPHGGIDFGVAFYGAPVVAFVVIMVSFFTAKRPRGIVVPLIGWALLIIDVALMAATVS